MFKNYVISGDYASKPLKVSKDLFIEVDPKTRTRVCIDSNTVRSYELIQVVQEDVKFSTSLKKGIKGGILAGGIGAMAGVATAKGETAYKVKIAFKDGKTSLIIVDELIYQIITNECFNLEPSDTNPTQQQSSPSIAGASRFCSNCGAPLTGAAKFCSSCGYANEASVASAPSVTPPPAPTTFYAPAFSSEVAQNVIVYKGNRYDLDSIYVECKGKPIKFSMRMMKEAKNAKMTKDETKKFTETVDLFFKPKVAGQTPNIGVITIS